MSRVDHPRSARVWLLRGRGQPARALGPGALVLFVLAISLGAGLAVALGFAMGAVFGT